MVSQLTLLFRDKLQTTEENETQNTVTAEKRSKKKKADSSETAKSGSDSSETDNVFGYFFSSPISSSSFKMPLRYPDYRREDYENMSEEELDRLLDVYGLPVLGDLSHKKAFAIGAFLWEKDIVYEQEESSPPPPDDCFINPNSVKSRLGLTEALREMVRLMFRV
ncbi:PREDICTED: uncharacterized protein LOC104824496 [Tarenaya hassleriana]|uniref:uncharacterized protein LOC104824496 n=1 Tax=Tarenaya hassleriana TaxID=28532 RepID=UPI00053C5CD1|nr:PREDICTED: uncharacterized protein LOC104824496 [Tarenaya hassleriana]